MSRAFDRKNTSLENLRLQLKRTDIARENDGRANVIFSGIFTRVAPPLQ